MAIYSLARRTTNNTSGQTALELRSSSSNRFSLIEICFSGVSALQTYFGLGTPAAIGVTPTSPVTVLAEDPAAPAGTAQTALAWGTGPTIPTNFFRRMRGAATIGNGFCLTFMSGITVAISSSIVLWNLGSNALIDVWVVVEE